MLDPATSVLRLADLQYDLASAGFFLRLADRLHRAELPGLLGEVRVEPVRILGVGIAGGPRPLPDGREDLTAGGVSPS